MACIVGGEERRAAAALNTRGGRSIMWRNLKQRRRHIKRDQKARQRRGSVAGRGGVLGHAAQCHVAAAKLPKAAWRLYQRGCSHRARHLFWP